MESQQKKRPTLESHIVGTTIAAGSPKIDTGFEPEQVINSNEGESGIAKKQKRASKSSEAPDSVNVQGKALGAEEAAGSAVRGENRFQVLHKLEDATWKVLYVGIVGVYEYTSYGTINFRRNMVLDSVDQSKLHLVPHPGATKFITCITDVEDGGLLKDGRKLSDHLDEYEGPLDLMLSIEATKEGSGVKSRWEPQETNGCMLVLDVQLKEAGGNPLQSERVVADEKRKCFKHLSWPSKITEDGQRKAIRTLLFEHSQTGLQLEADISPLMAKIDKNAKFYLYQSTHAGPKMY